MLQLDNKTPFAANIALFANERGGDCLYVIAKGSFTLGKQWTLLDEQIPPQEADEYYDEAISSSLKVASDYHIGKPGTDIIMSGEACSKDGKLARVLDVELQVGDRQKIVRVFGDRSWQNGRISNPEPFSRMPLVYERAFGGCHRGEDGEVIAQESRNPVGLSYLGKRNPAALEGQALPNLEDPVALIRSEKDKPVPACFDYVAPNWQPRVNFAGTYDEQWQQQRAPFLPLDFDRRFLSAAHPDLICKGFLSGGEAVKIVNMHPRGDLHFQLPLIHLNCRVNVDGNLHKVPINIETLILQPNDLRVSMVWKAEFPCEKNVPKIREITLALARQ